ncbi:hypothetical protein SAMN04487936_101432 [Halobacillus dabanensis]|uniref:Uncharacterized protein n=1 Tax=Halobacillus dabanensis TaxID=240302 RepID=A0A1I3PT61_HALDA|nr:hypothetical protein [Halobacillus dabanensis]SFJ24580.1 hypothetical protein SAMN04487936_101432 [Halobacillus dabanensis]
MKVNSSVRVGLFYDFRHIHVNKLENPKKIVKNGFDILRRRRDFRLLKEYTTEEGGRE